MDKLSWSPRCDQKVTQKLYEGWIRLCGALRQPDTELTPGDLYSQMILGDLQGGAEREKKPLSSVLSGVDAST